MDYWEVREWIRFFPRLIATIPALASDDVPSIEHQDPVTALAEEYLGCLAVSTTSGARLDEINEFMRQNPLIGMEVLDEAFVLHKNRKNLWGNTAAQRVDSICPTLGIEYNRFSSLVITQRKGRERRSTTPTLKGGEPRLPAASVSGKPAYLPLIFALKDLRIGYFPDLFSSPREFSRLACLLRGDTPLPTGDDAKRSAHLKAAPEKAPPDDPMVGLLRMDLGKWPEDAFVAVRGITAFGAGDNKLAEQCALHALRLNRECVLAQQLLELLSQKQDPRVPFTNVNTETRDVLQKMAGSATAATPAKPRPWWRFW